MRVRESTRWGCTATFLSLCSRVHAREPLPGPTWSIGRDRRSLAAWRKISRSSAALAGAPCHAFPGILGDAGYRTGLFHSGRFDYLGMEAVIRNRGYQTL